jgi:hypothetical protein
MSKEPKREEWKSPPCPFIFVLKEGPSHQKNLFDYSLCMMQIKSEAFHIPPTKMMIAARNKYDTRMGQSAPPSQLP